MFHNVVTPTDDLLMQEISQVRPRIDGRRRAGPSSPRWKVRRQPGQLQRISATERIVMLLTESRPFRDLEYMLGQASGSVWLEHTVFELEIPRGLPVVGYVAAIVVTQNVRDCRVSAGRVVGVQAAKPFSACAMKPSILPPFTSAFAAGPPCGPPPFRSLAS